MLLQQGRYVSNCNTKLLRQSYKPTVVQPVAISFNLGKLWGGLQHPFALLVDHCGSFLLADFISKSSQILVLPLQFPLSHFRVLVCME